MLVSSSLSHRDWSLQNRLRTVLLRARLPVVHPTQSTSLPPKLPLRLVLPPIPTSFPLPPIVLCPALPFDKEQPRCQVSLHSSLKAPLARHSDRVNFCVHVPQLPSPPLQLLLAVFRSSPSPLGPSQPTLVFRSLLSHRTSITPGAGSYIYTNPLTPTSVASRTSSLIVEALVVEADEDEFACSDFDDPEFLEQLNAVLASQPSPN